MKKWIVALATFVLVAASFSHISVPIIEMGEFALVSEYFVWNVRHTDSGGTQRPMITCTVIGTVNSCFVANPKGSFAFTYITPATITADQNNYAPTGCETASVFRLESDALRNITGINASSCFASEMADANKLLILYNKGATNSIVLKNADAASDASNRFNIGSDYTIAPGESVTLMYDLTQNRWVHTSDASPAVTLAGDVDGASGANDLDEAAVEAELEGVLDLNDLQGTLNTAKLTDDPILETEMDTFSEWVSQVGVTGTPDGTKFLRDDGSFQSVPGGGGDSIRVEDGDNGGTFTAMSDADFDDSGDINFTRAAGPPDVITATVRADSVTLGTDTTNNYVASVATTGPLAGGAAGSEGTAISLTTSMSTSRLIGRTTAGTGVMEEITVSSPLTFSALTLDINAIADSDLASSYSGVGACGANTWASTLNDNAAPTCTQPAFSNISGTASDAQVDGSLETGEVVGTETDEALCSWEATGTIIECDLTVNAGTNLTADLEEEAHCSEHDSADVDCSGETILIAAGAVSADELDEAGVEAGLEGVLDLLDLQDGATDNCAGLEVVRRNAGDTAFECAAASGGVTDAEYIVGEAHAGLSAEVAPSADDQIPLSSSSTAAVWVAVPNCNTENHLTYATGTNTFGCEADDGGGGGGLSYAQVVAANLAGF